MLQKIHVLKEEHSMITLNGKLDQLKPNLHSYFNMQRWISRFLLML
jgi:hypothetical protein